jgi:hypothetical protein
MHALVQEIGVNGIRQVLADVLAKVLAGKVLLVPPPKHPPLVH